MGEVLLRACELSVHYGATAALDRVDLDIVAGEVHAVVGENGAGKSTLLRALADVVRPSAGRIDRQVAELEWVPQDTSLPLDLTVSEWIFLGRELRTRGWLQKRAMTDATAAALHVVGCSAVPHQRLATLPLPVRKLVQLARALHGRPRVLLLDEPTAVLGNAETQRLFSVVRDLKRRGTAVLYVSHRLQEVMAIADRVTVLRDGRHVSTDPVQAVDVASLVQRMVGREIPPHLRVDRPFGPPTLRLIDLTAAHVRDLSLTVRGGEVVGLAGLVGAGRSEVLEAIAGLRRPQSGRIETPEPPAFVPEDRGAKGLIFALGMRENIFLPAEQWRLRTQHERSAVRDWIARLGIRASGTEAPIDSLSGGNQQKVLLARALRHQPGVLLLDEPTAGVDVGAKAEIHALIRQLALTGTTILLASSDLPELLVLCDRIIALRAGQCAGEVSGAEATEPQLAALITGAAA